MGGKTLLFHFLSSVGLGRPLEVEHLLENSIIDAPIRMDVVKF